MHQHSTRSAADRLQMAIAALPEGGHPFAVLQVGFDGLSPAEDNEALLDAAHDRLQMSIREGEAVVRLPQNEFTVLLRSVPSVVHAGAAADRLAAILQEPFLLCGRHRTAAVSVGLALAPEDGRTAETLSCRAALALRHAQSTGTGLVQFYEPAMEDNRGKCKQLSLDTRILRLLQQWQGAPASSLNLLPQTSGAR